MNADHVSDLLYSDDAVHTAPASYAIDKPHIASLSYPLPGVSEHVTGLSYGDSAHHSADLVHVDDTEHTAPLVFSIPGASEHVAELAYLGRTEHVAPFPVHGIAEHIASLLMSALEGRVDHVVDLRYEVDSEHGATLAYATRTDHAAPLDYLPIDSAEHAAGLAIIDTNPGMASHIARLPINDDAVRDVGHTVELTQAGRRIGMISIALARSQGQAYWTADIELASTSDYHRFFIGSGFSVWIDDLEWKLIVDRRQLTRDGIAQSRPAIRGLSTSAAYDAPFAEGITRTWETAASASSIVGELLAGLSITWNLIDWIIPGYRFAVDGMTPMAAAAKIVAAVGGTLETMPDGSVVARPLHPVTVPDMDAASYDALVSNVDDIYTVSEALNAARGMNRVRIYDTSPGTALNDRLEYEGEDLVGVVRAYPSPWRTSVRLRHSRGIKVTLTPRGVVTRLIEDELIEIKGGIGNARYPIVGISSAAYESDGLGSITFAPYSNEVRTGIAGYSLLRISYSTRSIDNDAVADEELVAQMILEDL